jgi:hypothetical protein
MTDDEIELHNTLLAQDPGDQTIRAVFAAFQNMSDPIHVRARGAALNSIASANNKWLDATIAKYLRIPRLAERLTDGDQTVIEEMSSIDVGRGQRNPRPRYMLSFATKMAAYHASDHFCIYDSIVVNFLVKNRDHIGDSNIKITAYRSRLKQYAFYVQRIERQSGTWGLRRRWSLREIEGAIWRDNRRR